MLEKKVLIATGIYPPDIGGPARFAESFQDWALTHDVSVEVLSLTDDKYQQKSRVDVHLIPRRKVFIRYPQTIWHLSIAFLRHRRILANGLFIEVLLASLCTAKKNYVCKVPGDIVWERARNCKATSLTIEEFQNNVPFRFRIFRFLYSWSLRRARLVIVPSQHLRDLCISWGVKKRSIRLIHNSVEVTSTLPVMNQARYDVVTVCRLVQWKGLDSLISICADLDLSLCIVGIGPEFDNLMRLSESRGTQVTFAGSLSQSEIDLVLRQSKCFVLNSNFEASSFALLEARARGLICIARRSTGSEEVINDGIDGFLCSNDEELRQKLASLEIFGQLSSPARILAWQDTAQRFNQEVNFKEIYKLVTGI